MIGWLAYDRESPFLLKENLPRDRYDQQGAVCWADDTLLAASESVHFPTIEYASLVV